jgi:tetratricopeptide (TPR) repeat protein
VLEAINELVPVAWDHFEVFFGLVHKWYLHGADFWMRLPVILRQAVMLALFLAIIGTITSLIKAISNNYKEWKPIPDSKLMFSYFCGSGDHQRRLIHKNAKTLVVDRTWPWISAAGIAYRLGNISHNSKIVTFLLSFIYLPVAVIGAIELVFRTIIGYITYPILNIVVAVIYLLVRLTVYIIIPIFRVIDAAMRVEQHCPHCYNTFKLPRFKCPHCGEIHEQLIPARSGLLFARCSCGHFLPCAVLSKRDKLDPVCPKCNRDLAASNAKEFSIQVIGGDSAGKTAFISAFQHMYRSSVDAEKCAIYGEPKDAFDSIETMFINGCTEPSSSSEVIPYTIVHQLGSSARQSLVFYDIPDEVLLSEEYERNPLNFGFSDGIVVIIDPLSVQSVRNECGKLDVDSVDGSSRDSSESIVIHFITKFSEISGRAARKMSGIPVAVLVAKSDVKGIKEKIGSAKIESIFKADPARYQNDVEIAADDICRQFLSDIGLSNILNNLDAVFSMVRCFPISSIGHVAMQGHPFEPYGVIEPIAWIGEKGHAVMSAQLREARDFVSADGFQENMVDRNLAERYAKAEKLLQESRLFEAAEIFAGLGNYKDAADQLKKIREICYQTALKKKSDCNFDGAIKDFTALGSYKDSLQQVVFTQYAKTDYLVSLHQYQDALGVLDRMRKSEILSEKICEVKYSYALFLIQNKDYIAANDIFTQLGDYRDCKEKIRYISLGLTQQKIKAGSKRKIRFGKYEWRVLTINNGVALIITENTVKNIAYSDDLNGVCWSECSVRQYLNTTFYDEFSLDEKALIPATTVKTSDNPEYSTPGGADTSDRVFLLSIEEALQFFSDDADRKPDKSSPGVEADWTWLRSSGGERTFAAIIEKSGKVSAGGSRITNLRGGVRPVIFVKL